MKSEEDIVREFAEEMIKKIFIRRNRYVPFAWKTMDQKRLVTLLYGEIAELEEETDFAKIADEALDVANFAMFIWSLNQENVQKT